MSEVEKIARILCRQAGHDPDGAAKCGFGWLNFEKDAAEILAALQSSRPVGGEAEAAKRLVEIIEDAGRGYNITLTKLVDGEAEYTMTYRGNVTLHPDIDDAHELRQKLAEQEKLEAALAFLRSLPEQDRRHEG